jgi:hypothetical protein
LIGVVQKKFANPICLKQSSAGASLPGRSRLCETSMQLQSSRPSIYGENICAL